MDINPILTKCVFYNYKIDTNIKNKTNNYISEIVSCNPFLENEINIVNKIKNKILDYNDYYYLLIDYYSLSLQYIQDEQHIYQDNNYNNVYHINTDINAKINKNKLSSEYLIKFEKKNIIYLKDYLISLSSSRKYLFQLIHFYKYLLNGIQKLVDINIIHCNIHLDKLLVDTNKENCIFLNDFRYSIEINTNNLDEYILNKFSFQDLYLNNNVEIPIEFYILSYMTINNIISLSQYNIHNIIDNIYKKHYTFLQSSFGDEIYNQYINNAKEYYSKYVNKNINYIWLDMINWFYTWDNYSVSMIYIKILIGLHSHLKNKIKNINSYSEKYIIKNKFLLSFMKLLVINIHPNPLHRKKLSDTLNIFNSILYSCETRDYKELINNI